MASSTLQVMDLTSLKAVLADLSSEMLPSRFEKAQQPDPHSLQLGFRTLKGMIWLELSWQAEAARLVRIPPPNGPVPAARWRNRFSTACASWRSSACNSTDSSGWCSFSSPHDPVKQRSGPWSWNSWVVTATA